MSQPAALSRIRFSLATRPGAIQLRLLLGGVLFALALTVIGSLPVSVRANDDGSDDQQTATTTSGDCQTYSTRSMGFWKNHTSLWQLPQTLGNDTVGIFTDAQSVFNNYEDNATSKLKGQLLALKFSIAYYGAGPGLVPGTSTTLSTLAAQADALLQNGTASESEIDAMKNLVESAVTAHTVSSCTTPTTAQLKVVKQVVNDNGGTKQASDFSLHVKSGSVDVSNSPAAGSTSGTTYTLDPGYYQVGEDSVLGYQLTGFSGACDASGNVTLAAGDNKTCTVTNNDVAQPTQCVLELTKSVSSATAAVGDTLTYTLTIKNTGTADCTGGGVKVKDVVDPLLTYVSSTNSSNITAGYGSAPLYSSSTRTLLWNAQTLTPGEQGTISWTATINAPSTCGTFDVANTAKTSSNEYNNFGTWVESNTVHTTGIAPCAATLIVKKHVVNDNGGTLNASNFTLNVTGTNVSQSSFSGSETGTTVTLDPGSYSVDEATVSGYAKSLSTYCSGTISAGQTKTCTVTNNDLPPATQCVLELTKSVSSATAAVGDTLTYTLTIKNTGTADCTGGGVKVKDVVDPLLNFVSSTNSSNISQGYGSSPLYNTSTRTLLWNANTLVPNETGSITWVATVNTPSLCGPFDIANIARTTSLEYNNFSTWVDSNTVHTTGSTICVGDLATLVVKKHVDNSGGGTKTAADFDLHVKSGSTDVINSPAAGSEAGVTYTLPVGTYTVSEDAPLDGYTNLGITGDCDAGGFITLGAGDTKTCTITNASRIIPGILVVKKHVINNNTGVKTAADFTLHVKNGVDDVTNSPAAGSETGVSYNLAPGTYVVSEDVAPTGYVKVGLTGDCAADGSVTVQANVTKTCTITNDDQLTPPPPGSLVLKKHVVNTHGGTKTAADFTLHVMQNSADVTGSPDAGSETGVTYQLTPGDYLVTEDPLPANYVQSGLSGDCSTSGAVTIESGVTKTCTVTNSDQTPPPTTATLIVKKHVVNTHGGTKTAADFNLHVKSGVADVTGSPAVGSETGTSYTLAPGDYKVLEEAAPTGYVQTSIGDDCDSTGNVALAAGQTKTCTITNSDVAPTAATLIVIKHVINDNGGTRPAGDFNMNVTGTNVSQTSFSGDEAGTTITLAPGSYSVDEDTEPGYTKSLSQNCSGTIAAGETKTCTITNNDTSGGGGGGGGGGLDCSSPSNRVEPTLVNISIPTGGVAGSTAALNLTYGTDITSIILSNADSFSPQTAVTPASVVSWTLSSGTGAKTVYARFYNTKGCFAQKSTATEVTTTGTPPPPQVLGAACINLPAEAAKVTSPNQSIAQKYSGRILLQCEAGSTAWYLAPSSNQRFYLPPGKGTYDVLRAFAMPLSNANLAKIPLGLTNITNPTPALPITSVDTAYAAQQKGRVFIQVEAHGELWYVSPDDAKRYFVPATNEASLVAESVGQCTPDTEFKRISLGYRAGATALSTVSSCYPPAPQVLGESTELPRTGFPTDILFGLPLLAIMAIGFTTVGREWSEG